MSEPSKSKRNWTAVKCDSFDAMRKLRIKQWQEVSWEERMAAAWQLTVEAWKAKGKKDDEFRLQRSVATLVRRGS
jgi:hypothetical protein